MKLLYLMVCGGFFIACNARASEQQSLLDYEWYRKYAGRATTEFYIQKKQERLKARQDKIKQQELCDQEERQFSVVSELQEARQAGLNAHKQAMQQNNTTSIQKEDFDFIFVDSDVE